MNSDWWCSKMAQPRVWRCLHLVETKGPFTRNHWRSVNLWIHSLSSPLPSLSLRYIPSLTLCLSLLTLSSLLLFIPSFSLLTPSPPHPLSSPHPSFLFSYNPLPLPLPPSVKCWSNGTELACFSWQPTTSNKKHLSSIWYKWVQLLVTLICFTFLWNF